MLENETRFVAGQARLMSAVSRTDRPCHSSVGGGSGGMRSGCLAAAFAVEDSPPFLPAESAVGPTENLPSDVHLPQRHRLRRKLDGRPRFLPTHDSTASRHSREKTRQSRQRDAQGLLPSRRAVCVGQSRRVPTRPTSGAQRATGGAETRETGPSPRPTPGLEPGSPFITSAFVLRAFQVCGAM